MELDDKGYCCVFTEDGVVTNIDYYEQDNLFVMHTTFGVIPEKKRLQIYDLMLKGNFAWKDTAGAMTCVDPSGQVAMLMTDIPIDGLDGEQFFKAFTLFGSLTWAWSEKLREIAGEEEEAAAQPSQNGADGFLMRV